MDWVDQGLCRAQPDRMFAEGAAQNEAKAVCVACPVRLDCLAHALDHREEYGVWGAMTERERRVLLRRRPAVTSWAEIFRTAATHAVPAPVATSRDVSPAVDRTPSRFSPARRRRRGTAPAELDR
ncbi:WhiB family transcriptional regulator [Streptomyces flaveolus]|uniref:WhiB family transcriptional regulator n=1 Tax=Streptomyces flaveolus TaxID=67297 RepID=UPI00340BE4C0